MNLLEMIKDAGVIGAGGAGFPTHVKLASKAEFLLMNAAECEPLLRVDQQLMEVFADEILLGFEAAGRLVEAKEAIIGIKEKHKDVIRHLNERIQALNLGNYIRVQALKDVYPAGDEQVLVYELTGRVVPEAGIPIQVGCVVVNSETALNIYNATRAATTATTSSHQYPLNRSLAAIRNRVGAGSAWFMSSKIVVMLGTTKVIRKKSTRVPMAVIRMG